MAATNSKSHISLRRLLIVIFLSRSLLDTAYRAVYPFLPFIAADLGVSIGTAAELIQTRNLVGLTAPFFGPLSDRYGRRNLMLVGLSITFVTCLLLGVFTSFAFAIAAMMLMGLGSVIFIPAALAYLGDRVPYAERGRAMGLSELSWSAAALVGLPLFGIAVQFSGWRTGFVALGIVGMAALIFTWFFLPDGSHLVTRRAAGNWWQALPRILHTPGAAAALATTMLMAVTNENLNVIYGVWMEKTFALDAIALGGVAAAIGAADLSGELFATAFVDKIGKHRVVAICLLLGGAAYALLPFIAKNVWLGSLGLFSVYFFFELGIVAALPLLSELAPGARATLLSLNVAGFSLGRAVGSFTGPYLFSNFGVVANGLASAFGLFVAFVIWQSMVRERD